MSSHSPSDLWSPPNSPHIPTITRISSSTADAPPPPPPARSRSLGGAIRLPSLSSLQLPGFGRPVSSAPRSPPRIIGAPDHDRATSAGPRAASPNKTSSAASTSYRTTVSGHRVPSRSFSLKECYSPSPENAPSERDSKKRQCDCCGAAASRHGPRGKNTLCSNCGLSFLRKVKTLTTKGASEEALAEAANDFIETRSKYIEYKRSRDRTSSNASASSTSTNAEDDVAKPSPRGSSAEASDAPSPLPDDFRGEYAQPYWSYPASTPLHFPVLQQEALPQIPFPSSYPAEDYSFPRLALPPQPNSLQPHHFPSEPFLPQTTYPSPRPSHASISRSSSMSDLRYSQQQPAPYEPRDPAWELEELGMRKTETKWSDERAAERTLTQQTRRS